VLNTDTTNSEDVAVFTAGSWFGVGSGARTLAPVPSYAVLLLHSTFLWNSFMRTADIFPLFPSWNWRVFGTNVVYHVNSLPRERRSTDTANFVLCCVVLLDCGNVTQKTNFGLHVFYSKFCFVLCGFIRL
jgi:hypothetical protein